jgi:hypothetical protein
MVLIGVEEIRGSRSRPVGVDVHLDDANVVGAEGIAVLCGTAL